MQTTPAIILFLSVVYGGNSVGSGDRHTWPHLRGPEYDAIAQNGDLVDSWPEDGPPVLWMRDIGRGYSGFVIAKDRAYTQGQALTGQYVYCLDLATGDTLWRCRYGDAYGVGGMYPGPRATPTYSEGHLYFADPCGVVGCVDADSGSLQWKRNILDDLNADEYGFGYSCTPVVEAGLVVLPVGGAGASVVALDINDGRIVWTTGNEQPSYCGVVPITLADRRCGIIYLENALLVFDWMSGDLLCEHRLGGGYNTHAALPLYREPYVVLMSPFRSGAQMFRLELEQPGDGHANTARVLVRPVWHVRHLSNDIASSVLLDDAIYGFDLRDVQAKPHRPSRGEFRCLDLMTGDVHWSSDTTGHATVLVADGKLVLLNDRGQLILAEATTESYQELARADVFLGEMCWTAPAIHDHRLYLRTPTRAACVYLGDPKELSVAIQDRVIPTSAIKQRRSLDLNVLIGGEREYLWDPPDLHEHTRCCLASLGAALVPAWLLAILIFACLRGRLGSMSAGSLASGVFWGVSLVLGIAATPLLNHWLEAFYFTWPFTLAVALLALVALILHVEGRSDRGHARWLTRVLGIAFLLLVGSYFFACGRLSLPLHWIFITGLVPAAFLALPAGKLIVRSQHRLIVQPLVTAVYFVSYYWISVALLYGRITYWG